MSGFVLCCISPVLISETFLDDLKLLLKNKKIHLDKIHHLTRPHLKALDLSLQFSHEIDIQKIKIELMDLSNKYQVDIALFPQDEGRRNKRLIVFDMDSTLIQHEVIDEMAIVRGVGDQVKNITERAMNGEINFDQALKERVALLKGLRRDQMEEIVSHLKLSPGAEKLIRVLKGEGFKTAIISGGFKYFAESFKTRLGLDYAFANDLEIDGDVLTGKISGKIVNASEKARLLDVLAEKENISVNDIVAVGDGANDLPMLAKAGMGIAFHAKEKVRLEARYQMAHGPMTSILYFLGIPGEHFDETL